MKARHIQESQMLKTPLSPTTISPGIVIEIRWDFFPTPCCAWDEDYTPTSPA
jgi:hypothetical protein